MGLRERKKISTRESILSGARSLFLRNGYRATSMEMIASESDVAVGTIYNYFRSKAEVMVEICRQDTDSAIVTLSKEELKANSVEDSLWLLLEGSLEALTVYPREIFKEVFAAVWESSESSLSRGLLTQDERMLAHFAATLSSLKAMGKLKPETDPETVSFAIYGIMAGGLMWYAVDERTGMEETKERIAAMVGQFCRGIVPEGAE